MKNNIKKWWKKINISTNLVWIYRIITENISVIQLILDISSNLI